MAWHYVEDYEELTGQQRELADDPDAPPAKAGVKAKVVTPPTKATVGAADVQVETA
ncbi:MAG: hypothetical protein ABI429_07895 [Jatrophihabitantaceae bacterium]